MKGAAQGAGQAGVARHGGNTQQNICSMDPPGCQDIDDTLHTRRRPNGVETGVCIADVSYVVKAGTPMDADAASRGTTVYLVDKRINVLLTYSTQPLLAATFVCNPGGEWRQSRVW